MFLSLSNSFRCVSILLKTPCYDLSCCVWLELSCYVEELAYNDIRHQGMHRVSTNGFSGLVDLSLTTVGTRLTHVWDLCEQGLCSFRHRRLFHSIDQPLNMVILELRIMVFFLLGIYTSLWIFDICITLLIPWGFVHERWVSFCVAHYSAGWDAFAQDSSLSWIFSSNLGEVLLESFLDESPKGGFDSQVPMFSHLKPFKVELVSRFHFAVWCMGHIIGDAFHFFGWYAITESVAIVLALEILPSSFEEVVLPSQGAKYILPIRNGIVLAKAKTIVSIITMLEEYMLPIEDNPYLTVEMQKRKQVADRLESISFKGVFDGFREHFILSLWIIVFKHLLYYCMVRTCWRIIETTKRIVREVLLADTREEMPRSFDSEESSLEYSLSIELVGSRSSDISTPSSCSFDSMSLLSIEGYPSQQLSSSPSQDFESDYTNQIYYAGAADTDSSLSTSHWIEIKGDILGSPNRPTSLAPNFEAIEYHKKKEERHSRPRRFSFPPPNFFRMMRRKQEKEMRAERQRREEAEQGFILELDIPKNEPQPPPEIISPAKSRRGPPVLESIAEERALP